MAAQTFGEWVGGIRDFCQEMRANKAQPLAEASGSMLPLRFVAAMPCRRNRYGLALSTFSEVELFVRAQSADWKAAKRGLGGKVDAMTIPPHTRCRGSPVGVPNFIGAPGHYPQPGHDPDVRGVSAG